MTYAVELEWMLVRREPPELAMPVRSFLYVTRRLRADFLMASACTGYAGKVRAYRVSGGKGCTHRTPLVISRKFGSTRCNVRCSG